MTGRTGSVDGDGNAADAEQDGYGFDTGIDYRGPDNGWALGATVGYVNGALNVDQRFSRAEYDGWHVGGYGRYGTGGAGITVSGAIDYGAIDAIVTRAIRVNQLERTARGSADLDTIALEGEARYGFALGNGWATGPVASIHYASSDLASFAESGANALDLSSAGADDEVTRFGGGLFTNWQGGRGGIDVSAQYVDGHSNVAQVGMTLAGAPGALFPTRSPRIDGAAALLGLAGRYELGDGWTLGAETRALIGREEHDIAGSITIGWRF